MNNHKIGILGSGTMGKQIALLCASHGMTILLWNHIQHQEIETDLKKMALLQSRLGTIAKDDLENIFGRITIVNDMQELAGCDVFFEAVKEDLNIKAMVLTQLNKLIGENKIISSNTSTLSITNLASNLNNPSRVIGMHFFNPVFSMKLVEVVKGEYTSDETVETISNLITFLQKNPVILPETPGFVVNRLLFPMINEAIFLLSEGIADAKTIDSCMKLGANHPMGPLELADLIGLDVCLSILETLVSETGDDKYRPAPLLRKLVRAGKLGRKSGVGFYAHKRK
jgi:3-hydroxybutyryl-CoA dehydrogenase